MNGHRFKLWFVLLVALLPIACECGDCCCEAREEREVREDRVFAPPPERAECLHTWDSLVLDNVRAQEGSIRLSSLEPPAAMLQNQPEDRLIEAWNIPEYNDCQRFIVPGADGARERYGGLYAIFAAQLESLHTRTSAHSPPDVAAVIFSPDGTPYEPLGVTGTWQCLAISGDVATPDAPLQASMIPVDNPFKCVEDLDHSRGTMLEVVRTSEAPNIGRDDDYPPVARWGFDETGLTQYAIVRCGRAMCFIGASGFTPRAMPVVPAAQALGDASLAQMPMLDRVFRVAGWHDTQRLAVVDSELIKLVPSDTWATVFPHPSLASWNYSPDSADEWHLVAWVAITSDIYEGKLGLTKTVEGGALNRIYACFGENCEGARETCESDDESRAPGGDPGSIDWRTKIINARGETKQICSRRYDDTKEFVLVPGTTRFRWKADDEQLWYRCMEGCCDTEGE